MNIATRVFRFKIRNNLIFALDFLLHFATLFYFIGNAFALNNGLGRTPQMGWNSWNAFGCDINETKIIDTIDAMVEKKLPSFGYQYVIIDDCWSVGRDSNGVLIPDPNTFPHGIKFLADYAHSKGLKFGIYSDAGNYTCAGRPGSRGYEVLDAKTFAAWGVDYLKYDNCYAEKKEHPIERYRIMRDALNATGRPIFFSLCDWGVEDPWTWGMDIGNSWRTTDDIADNWAILLSNIDNSINLAKYAGPGGWNDPDMLEVGNGALTDIQYRSHFALWCLMKAPLILGNNIKTMNQSALSIVTAIELIRVNQDPLGVPGDLIWQEGPRQVWATTLNDGSRAVVLFNRHTFYDIYESEVAVEFQWLGYPKGIKATVRDLYERQDKGIFQDRFSIRISTQGVFAAKITPLQMKPEYKNWRPWYRPCTTSTFHGYSLK